MDKEKELKKVHTKVKRCKKCGLCETRTNVVFGMGDPNATLMFIGEAPGVTEDKEGLPFVGRSGKLLDTFINLCGYSRADFYIANIVKCRPPDEEDSTKNRAPVEDEVNKCVKFLHEQIEIIQPKIIILLGGTAYNWLIDKDTQISKVRGRWMKWNNINVMPTYHPSFMLRRPGFKKEGLADMRKVMNKLTDPDSIKEEEAVTPSENGDLHGFKDKETLDMFLHCHNTKFYIKYGSPLDDPNRINQFINNRNEYMDDLYKEDMLLIP